GSGDEDPAPGFERHGMLARKHAETLAVGQIEPVLESEPRQRAVHRAGVEVAEPEPLGEPPRDRALAGPCRAVDGNDHRLVTESRRSKRPGKLIETASAPPTSTPSRETSPATAPSIASRWSPKESIPPPFGREATPLTPKPFSLAEARMPRAFNEVVTASMRFDSFARNSCAPSTELEPWAIPAARANSGSSSISDGTSPGVIDVAVSGAERTSRAPAGPAPSGRRVKTGMRAPPPPSPAARPGRAGVRVE